jgi:hypothetical protein
MERGGLIASSTTASINHVAPGPEAAQRRGRRAAIGSKHLIRRPGLFCGASLADVTASEHRLSCGDLTPTALIERWKLVHPRGRNRW